MTDTSRQTPTFQTDGQGQLLPATAANRVENAGHRGLVAEPKVDGHQSQLVFTRGNGGVSRRPAIELAVKEHVDLFAFDEARDFGPAPCTSLPAPGRQQVLTALHRRVVAPARTIDIEMTLFAVTLTPQGDMTPCVFSDSGGRFWIASDPVHDPSQRDGRLPIPRVELERLVALRNAGLSVDLIVIAHELPQGWSPQMPVPPLVPAAPETTRADRRVVDAAQGLVHGIAAALRIAATVGAAVALAPTIGLDPVLLGGVTGSQGATAWSVLATWTWEVER